MMASFWAGAATGLAAGLLVGGGGVAALQATRPDPWIAAGGDWYRLPAQAKANPLPQVFKTPGKGWDYGAATRGLSAAGTTPGLVRVELAQVQGPIGVSLAKPDGSALISKEAKAPQGPGPFRMYFKAPGGQPVAVLLRNPGAEGQGGSVQVKSVSFVAQAKATPQVLAEANKAGVN